MSTEPLYTITLQPTGAQVTAKAGTPLREILFEQGVEFPCGGQGRCRGCKVRVLKGAARATDADRERLSEHELESGWRLACQGIVEDDLVIELRQWDATILANDAPFEFVPREGFGVAVDVGTTTVVAQLLDLQTGHVLGVRTALNPQARYGADVMSRVQFAVNEGGQAQLQEVIRHEVGVLGRQLLRAAGVDAEGVVRVAIVGNTVMHHLFSGIDVEPMSHYPFEPVDDGLQRLTPTELGWALPVTAEVLFLPCLGSFVGSDILAGLLATDLHRGDRLRGLIDLGTNGEIVLGNRDRMLCASTAAGPAFEGARIQAGMRAATGAIWKVTAEDGRPKCEILGNSTARGICGSGLVDAIAVGLDLGWILPSGRLANGATTMPLVDGIEVHQCDIRQLQLAKGAIAAGLHLMLDQWGASMDDVDCIYLAGAFGNYVNRVSARRIGLLRIPEAKVRPVGNTALLGAKIGLFSAESEVDYASIRSRMTHVGLNEDPRFQDVYVDEMAFPPRE